MDGHMGRGSFHSKNSKAITGSSSRKTHQERQRQTTLQGKAIAESSNKQRGNAAEASRSCSTRLSSRVCKQVGQQCRYGDQETSSGSYTRHYLTSRNTSNTKRASRGGGAKSNKSDILPSGCSSTNSGVNRRPKRSRKTSRGQSKSASLSGANSGYAMNGIQTGHAEKVKHSRGSFHCKVITGSSSISFHACDRRETHQERRRQTSLQGKAIGESSNRQREIEGGNTRNCSSRLSSRVCKKVSQQCRCGDQETSSSSSTRHYLTSRNTSRAAKHASRGGGADILPSGCSSTNPGVNRRPKWWRKRSLNGGKSASLSGANSMNGIQTGHAEKVKHSRGSFHCKVIIGSSSISFHACDRRKTHQERQRQTSLHGKVIAESSNRQREIEDRNATEASKSCSTRLNSRVCKKVSKQYRYGDQKTFSSSSTRHYLTSRNTTNTSRAAKRASRCGGADILPSGCSSTNPGVNRRPKWWRKRSLNRGRLSARGKSKSASLSGANSGYPMNGIQTGHAEKVKHSRGSFHCKVIIGSSSISFHACDCRKTHQERRRQTTLQGNACAIARSNNRQREIEDLDCEGRRQGLSENAAEASRNTSQTAKRASRGRGAESNMYNLKHPGVRLKRQRKRSLNGGRLSARGQSKSASLSGANSGSPNTGSVGDGNGYQHFSKEGTAEERIEQDEELTYEQQQEPWRDLSLDGPTFHDQHRDMRMDVDAMTYEELLALTEKMGSVTTGLTEEALSKCLEKSMYEPAYQVSDFTCCEEDIKCSICQEEYVVGDEVGKLACRHRYHVTCIHQWLEMKNWCPICKASAYAVS